MDGWVMRRRCLETVYMRDRTRHIVCIAVECVDGLYLHGLYLHGLLLLLLLRWIFWCWEDEMRRDEIPNYQLECMIALTHLLCVYFNP